MRIVHCRKEPYTHYIGRPSVFGNPFSHKDHTLARFRVSTVDEAVHEFEVYARQNGQLLDAIADLPEDAVLGCWCGALSPCHGIVIIKLWKEIHQ